MIRKFIRWVKRLVVYDELDDVRAFYEKFGQHIAPRPALGNPFRVNERINFMQEELDEFRQAALSGDLAGQADALVDLIYVAKGTALELGLSDCWEVLWQDVQRANMAKVIGKTHRGINIDVAKPPGWKGPTTEEILKEHGYGN